MDFLEDIYGSEMIGDMYAVESADIRLSKELLKLHTMDRLYEIDCMEKDMQFAMESVDDSEYIEYFSEAAKELDAKKENILKRAWAALKELVARVKAAFKKLTRKKLDPNANITVTPQEAGVIASIKREWSKVKPLLLSAKTEIKKHKVAVGFVALLATYGISKAVLKNHSKKVVVKGKQVNEAVEVADDIVETVEKVVNKSSGSTSSGVTPEVQTANINFMQEILRTTQQFNAEIQNTMHNALVDLNTDLQNMIDVEVASNRDAIRDALDAAQMANQAAMNASAFGMGMGPIM